MTLNPQPFVLDVGDGKETSPEQKALEETLLLQEMYKREVNLYAAGFIHRAPECPIGLPQKITVFCRETGRTKSTEIPAICNCSGTRFRMGIGTRHCKAAGICDVPRTLFPNGTFS